ncbi:uncharacterized protein LOC115320401 isoform X2 [Ixodes scapularis]|uniref:uncharacterized protein LOC115320401 isoform X2 n=1 Tax=Ixodes scapularis TaxID=6945 RepID=UPI001A9FF5CF|nr:uncharacterized protein LOC115320401 isoform X2 [Ixodes scapularis]
MAHAKPDYLSSLPEPERQRYRDKLRVDGVTFDDPYDVNKACWSSDVKLLPPTSMAHVVIYLVFSPSQFTADTVQAYKSLEAYNYFESGLVRECKLWKPQGAAVCFVRAKVMPSQRATTEAHDAWVCLTNASGGVRAAHCTCKAGLTEVCSHVAAVLYAVESTVRENTDGASCTSNPCVWSANVAKKAQMVPLDEINLCKPGKRARRIAKEPDHVAAAYVPEDEALFRRLQEVNPQAAILRSIPKLNAEDTDSASEDEETYSLLRNAVKSGSTKDSLPADLFVPLSEVERIEKGTRQQASCLLWKEARYGRLTASVMFRIRTLQPSTNPRSLVDCVLQRRPDVCTEGMRWGRDNEPNAKREYRLFMERNHNDFKLEDIGFVIDTRDSFIGASPDGIWSCSCHGVGILEVKCPAVLKEPGTPITRVDCLNDNLELPTFHKLRRWHNRLRWLGLQDVDVLLQP